MLAFFIAGLLVLGACCAQEQTQTTKPDSNKKKQTKKQSDEEADRIAEKILAETKELQVVPRWYDKVYPALKRKYRDPVSRDLYDTWRERYFRDEVAPIVMKDGYALGPAERQFMKLTDKQPPN